MESSLFVEQKALHELDLICAICHHVYINPVQILPTVNSHQCQHVFCRTCLHEWTSHNENNNNCPTCRAQIHSIIRDVRTQRLVAMQKVRCLRYQDGCTEEGVLGFGKQSFFHTHDLSCGFKSLKCECGEVVLRKNLLAHDLLCEERKMVDCPFSHCGCEVTLNRRVMKQHLQNSDREHLILVVRNSEVCIGTFKQCS
jgi:hypothetical protein